MLLERWLWYTAARVDLVSTSPGPHSHSDLLFEHPGVPLTVACGIFIPDAYGLFLIVQSNTRTYTAMAPALSSRRVRSAERINHIVSPPTFPFRVQQ